MEQLFHPRSVLVVGVSESPGNMGRNIVFNLLKYGYAGRVYLMGKTPGNVAGQEIHTSFATLPDGIDLAVLLTPAAVVPAVIEECGKKGIRWLAVESGGFSEFGDQRRELEARMLAAAGRYGIRFVGPNGLGVIDRGQGVVTPFMPIPALPPVGRVSLLAQSGGVGVVYLFALGQENQGLDKFVSMGNKLSLDEVDFLRYLGEAGTTEVACVYLEDIRRGRELYDTLRWFPGAVVVQKANVSRAGANAARSHTASLSTDDRLVDAALKQSGALRVHDMTSMVHSAMALSLPPVKGSRLLILSRSGGHAVIAADYAERFGFELPRLPEEIGRIAATSSRAHVIRTENPLDLGDVFDFERYAAMLTHAVGDPGFDAVAMIHVFNAGSEARDSERLIQAAAALTQETGKPIYVCLLTEGPELVRLKARFGYPLFATPEVLMHGMAASRDRHRKQEQRRAERFPAVPAMDEAGIARLLARVRAEGASRWLAAAEVYELLRLAGFAVAPHQTATSAEEAVAAAVRMQYPVALKLLSSKLLHKSGWGGVVLNVRGDAAVREEFAALCARLSEVAPEAPFEGVLVQKMVRGIREVFLGGRQDPSFGPVLMVGFGGVYVETLNDISVRLCPVSEADVEEMFLEVTLFRAFRKGPGRPAADFAHLTDATFRLSHLLQRFPQIAEMDLNPLKLFDEGDGGLVVDARIRV